MVGRKMALFNAERQIYRIDTPGAVGAYTIVSPPDSDGCILAAGTALDHIDLRRSRFSTSAEEDEH
jgi:hypothetical protein